VMRVHFFAFHLFTRQLSTVPSPLIWEETSERFRHTWIGGVFSASSSLAISASLLSGNQAGGAGGSGGSTGLGGSGGNGFGGRAYNAGANDGPFGTSPGGTLDLTDVLVIGNPALGEKGGSGSTNGNAGQGVGGGLYLVPLGTVSLTRTSVILNVASTSDPNIFGSAS
jgi:hypothetical protein